MEDREAEILSRLDSRREIWAETVQSASERLGDLTWPSVNDVAWLASLVGQLSMQAVEYSDLLGRLAEHRRKAREVV